MWHVTLIVAAFYPDMGLFGLDEGAKTEPYWMKAIAIANIMSRNRMTYEKRSCYER